MNSTVKQMIRVFLLGIPYLIERLPEKHQKVANAVFYGLLAAAAAYYGLFEIADIDITGILSNVPETNP